MYPKIGFGNEYRHRVDKIPQNLNSESKRERFFQGMMIQ